MIKFLFQLKHRLLILTEAVLININNRGIKNDIQFINIRKVPREILKMEGENHVNVNE